MTELGCARYETIKYDDVRLLFAQPLLELLAAVRFNMSTLYLGDCDSRQRQRGAKHLILLADLVGEFVERRRCEQRRRHALRD